MGLLSLLSVGMLPHAVTDLCCDILCATYSAPSKRRSERI